MKESISYTFLLNIIIVFMVVCGAIIAGVFSYYKAFRANSIISETIEKYEGYNCLSKEEIAKKLTTIGYKTPFNVSCNARDGKCEADNENGYKIISYDLDLDRLKTTNHQLYDEPMNSSYICDGTNGCTTNKHYQYGIYTYMYVDVPVVSSLIKMSFFSRTSIMYEYRNYYIEDFEEHAGGMVSRGTRLTEVESIFENLYGRNEYSGTNEELKGKKFITDAYIGKKVMDENGNINTNISASKILANITLNNYLDSSIGKQISYEYMFYHITNDAQPNLRTRIMIELLKGNATGQTGGEGKLQYLTSSIMNLGKDGGNNRRQCGYKLDYSKVNF